MRSPTVSRRAAVVAGCRRIFPLTLISGPFGLIYGVTAAENGIPDVSAIAASFIVHAGAAQIALVQLIGDDASWLVAVGTAVIINLRFALYSASLASAFADFGWRRFPLAHGLSDQAAVTAIHEFETEHDPQYRIWFFVGAATFFVLPWYVGTTIGVLAGGDIGPAWQLPFAVPATFVALLVPSIRSRPMLVAAIVGGTVSVITAFLPNGLNIIAGAFTGIAAGVTAAPTPEPGS